MGVTRSALESAIHLAYLDSSGIIVDVNEGWRKFTKRLQPTLRNSGIGRSYFDYCQDEALKANVRELLIAARETVACVYPQSLPDHNRWFVAIGLPCPGSAEIRAIMAHLDITRGSPKL